METKFYEYPNPVNNKGAGIEIRLQNEMSEDELFLLQQAELDTYAPLEAWTALGTNAQLSYSTHGIFRYFGKFPATIATHLIMEYTDEHDMILDPMAGSGTTAVEALLANRDCCSYDVNPLSVLLAKVKVTHIDKEELIPALEAIIDQYEPMTLEQYNWSPVGIKDIDHWFLPKTQDSIRGLQFQIQSITEMNVLT